MEFQDKKFKELLGWPFRVLKYICQPIYINADGIKVPKKEKDIMERWTSDFFSVIHGILFQR